MAAAMQARIDALLGTLTAADAHWWRDRLIVVDGRAATLDNWVSGVLSSHGRFGFAVDRGQRVRGMGMLADVTRYVQALSDAGEWPWENNLAYVANEARYFDAQAEQQARLDADGATIVSLFAGETLMEQATTEVALPDAATMAGFDTLEIEVTLDCPTRTTPELGNCGAWDYLAHLFVTEGTGEVEVARFITPYHRGAHWVVDATAALPWLRAGGARSFRWSFAPSWNTQPTRTHLALRLSNRARGVTPALAVPLYTGGGFGSGYNVSRMPIDVPIPADAARVDLVVIVTGHGAATNDCAEFCNHQHRFTVAGQAHEVAFPEAGTLEGCIAAIDGGETPNQGGTWWFGRGGWCPGAPVAPHVLDVTSDVTPGTIATVSYEGLFANQTPPDGSGDIVLSSWLVIYR
ncbi:MAG: hypothetical protein EXR73_10090 [Myxococcales bacterium]|nr:hypothetical protein [Myxococcales bacterium]